MASINLYRYGSKEAISMYLMGLHSTVQIASLREHDDCEDERAKELMDLEEQISDLAQKVLEVL